MKAALFHAFGDPAQVLQVEERPLPEPKPGEVRVRMLASPINPSDLLYVQGRYGKQPRLPAGAGFEGAGVVEASGGGIFGKFLVGKRVAVANGLGGNWAEHVVIPAKQAIMVPRSLAVEQVATFFVNPVTVLAMLDEVLQVKPGTWLLQTAAASTLGRMIIRLGRSRGFKTLNVVRRKDAMAELRALGGDAVVSTSEGDLEPQVREITHGQGVPYALDAVGGETGAQAVACLAAGGRMLCYGTLAMAAMPIDPRVLMVGPKSVQGFWLSEWARKQRPLKMLRLFRKVAALLQAGILTSTVEASYPLAQIQTAVAKASEPGRQGKILIRME